MLLQNRFTQVLVTLALQIKDASIIFKSMLNVTIHNFNIFAETFAIHGSNARAMPRVFDVSPTNLEDNDDITYFLFPIDFRWAGCLPTRVCITCQDVSRLSSFLISFSRKRHALNRCMELVINPTLIVQSRERLDLGCFSGPRRHLI